MKEKTIGFMITKNEKNELEQMAKASRRSLSELIRNLIENGKSNIAVMQEIGSLGNPEFRGQFTYLYRNSGDSLLISK